MGDREQYTFHINAYSPETIPMARLAEYLAQLAGLLGHTDSVHFVRVDGGSVKLVHEVEYESIPKVWGRLRAVTDLDGADDAKKHFAKLNDMLREDNGVATLIRNADNVLRFPGKEIPYPKKIGPITEVGTIEGMLIRIGGKDATVPAALADSQGSVYSCNVTRDMAREMAHHLFGAPLRIIGSGQWERQEDGTWKLLKFKAIEFTVLEDDSLSGVIARLQSITANAEDAPEEAIALLSKLRGDGLH